MTEVNPLENIIPQRPDSGAETTLPPARKRVPRKKTVVSPEPPKIGMKEFLSKQAERNQAIIDATGKRKVVKGRDWEGEKAAEDAEEETRAVAWDIFRKRKEFNSDVKDEAPSAEDFQKAREILKTRDRQDNTESASSPAAAEAAPVAPEKTIEELKLDLEAKADVYATARGNARGSRGYLAKLLGISKNVEETEEVKAARLEYLKAKKARSDGAARTAFEEYQGKLKSGTASPEALEALRLRWESIGNYHSRLADAELQGKFTEKTVEYYKTKGGALGKVFGAYLDFYQNVYLKKVPAKVRAAISVAMLAGTAASLAGAFGVAGTFAAAGAIVAKPARFLLAPLFPAMTYAGTGKMVEKGFQLVSASKGKKRSAAFGAVLEKMKSGEVSPEETQKNLLALLEEQGNEYGADLVNKGWWEDKLEGARNIMTMFVGARAVWVLMSGTEAISSFFEGRGKGAGVAGLGSNFKNIGASLKVDFHEDVGRALAHSPGGTLPDGKIIINPKGAEALGGGPIEHIDGAPELPEGQLEQVQKLAAAADAEAKARAMGEFVKSPATGAEINLPEDLQKPSGIPEPEAKTGGLRAPDAPEKIAGPKNILLGFDDVKQGGGIERSAQAIMRQDPEQFGFSPDDPKLNVKIGQKAHLLARDMAKSLGFEGEEGLKEFNRLASQRVQVGDQIRLFKDPSGNFNMEYSGGAFGEVSTPSAISETEISAPASEQIAPEEMGPKAGAGIVEQQPTRVSNAARTELSPQDVEESWQRVQEMNPQKTAEIARDLAIANQRLTLSTRAIIDRILEGANVGKRAAFWNQPMSSWQKLISPENYISQDALQSPGVEATNENLNKLRKIFELVEEYDPYKTKNIGQCFREAIADSKMFVINPADPQQAMRGASLGAYNLKSIDDVLTLVQKR